ncbi:MAG: fibronectin type III domain-containing protein, partial [Candidatus Freyarchaeota archaeon]
MKFSKAVAGILIIFCVLLLLTFLIAHPLSLLPATLPERVGVIDSPKLVCLTYQHSPASTITVTWKTETSTAGDVVLYDTIPRCGVPSSYRYSATGSHHSLTGASGYIHHVELTGLEPNTTYYFVCGGPGGYSGERSFRTAPSSTLELRFVAGGDSRSDPASRTLISKAMSLTNPSFVMHTGDMVEDGDIQSQWDAWFTDVHDNWIGSNGLSIPIVPCLGNHERNATNYYEQ